MARWKSWVWLGLALGQAGCLVFGRDDSPPGPLGGARCDEQREARPLVAEWPEAERRELEQRLRQGKLVVVRYAGCQLEPLYGCNAPGGYTYRGFSRKSEVLRVSSSEEMRLLMPRRSSEMQQAQSLDVQMELVGSYQAEGAPAAAQLSGACAGATHAVLEAMVGAFRLASAQSSRERGTDRSPVDSDEHALRTGGDLAACARPPRTDAAPPEGCDAAVRVSLSPLR